MGWIGNTLKTSRLGPAIVSEASIKTREGVVRVSISGVWTFEQVAVTLCRGTRRDFVPNALSLLNYASAWQG